VEEILMKNVAVSVGLAALLLASAARAQDITITWLVPDHNIATGYLPKLASDGIQNVVTIDEISAAPQPHHKETGGVNLNVFQSQIGTIAEFSVSWAGGSTDLHSPPQKTPQIGHAPSIALGYSSVDNYDTAIEVHQGGQDKEGSLWYQLGSNSPPSFGDIVWSHADRYGTGYNATVAVDLNGKSLNTAAVVEVHQEAVDESALWYQVGVLTLGSSPSISWGSSIEINGGLSPGFVPIVSVSNDLAVLVAEGSGGALWYALGVVDEATKTIAWTDPVPYGTTGYNPTVSIFGDGADYIAPGRVVVEAHQMANGTGPLVYSTAIAKLGTMGSSPTLTWSNTDIPYSAGGCYPSVAISFDGYTPPNPNGSTSNLSVTETHEIACGTATIEYSFGYLVNDGS
jgi:hypothetical protein